MGAANGERLAADVARLAESFVNIPGPVAGPTLVVVSGLPGTGKSYFSARLAEKLDFLVLESDALRKVLFFPPAYTAEESSHLFRVIHELIRQLLLRGIPLILDATNLSERHRESLYSIAEHTGAQLILIEVKAPPELVHSRLESRSAAATNSDAGWAVYQKMLPTVEEMRRHHYSVDTSQDISPVIEKIVKEVMRQRK